MTRPAASVRALALTLAGLGLVAGCGSDAGSSSESAPVTSRATIAPYDGPSSSPTSSPTSSPSPGDPTPTEPDDAAPAVAVPRSALPTELRIPAIDVSTPLVSLGLQDDDTVEVPSDGDRAGWYRYGATPGRAGAAVILGHVDSVEGPAVFARLGALEVGDEVRVELDTGQSVAYAVRAVRLYANEDFPAKRVYRSRKGHHDLNLVTCGGEYDRDNGGYQSNVVVFTRQLPVA